MSKLKAFFAGAAAGALVYCIVSHLSDGEDSSELESDADALNKQDSAEMADSDSIVSNAEAQA